MPSTAPPPQSSPPRCEPRLPYRPPRRTRNTASSAAPRLHGTIKIADFLGRLGLGLPAHVEEAILNVRNVFIANAELGGLDAYLHRASPQ